MFGVGDFSLETRVIIKICPILDTQEPLTELQEDEAKKKSFGKKKLYWKKHIQNGRLKKTESFKIANSQYFLWKFWGIGPWVNSLIDAKGIDVA